MPERTFVVEGARFTAPAAAPGLHIVATPIGNLGDITLRALRTLAGVDAVAAEDTRHTGRLLAHFEIEAHLLRYDEHGAAAQRPKILARLEAGGSVALVSDAGTPLISDPGYRLVGEARDAGHAVHVVPGPSAPVAALSVSGLPTDAFLFAGFLPPKQGARRTRIGELAAVPATLVFFEAPHRLGETLADLAAELGARHGAVARELTKRFETVERGTLDALAAQFAQGEVKGEIVILVGPPGRAAAMDEGEVDALLAAALARLPASAAAADVAKATGLNRRDLYRRALELKG
ncbi:16S rRNA (cytidine(1402)-2'-O)-methyltransferase [Acuticoccus kandeliae]|uniref:16S rRNA (cytidine(1402)-2'-O)-methyltransferase n=1 Tax=Acuticoccus kandeliae TaxID=2073160 RepID=UPI001FEA4C10|nr:16S rRNA (cytidine(1402)-2'-O)-methyltransferase [Acuticoccus kandeliae]